MQGQTERGATNAQLEDVAGTALVGETLLAAAGIGYWAHSWWVFGGALLVGYLALTRKPLAGLLAVIMTLFWGAVGWEIGRNIGDLGAIVVLTALGIIVGGVIHAGIIKWFVDWVRQQLG